MIAEEAGTGAANTEDADADADCQRHLASCHLTHWPPANEGPPKATEKGLLIGVLLGVAYFMHYFWKTPVFILPLDILGRHVVTVFSTDLDLQACFSMAYTFGCVAGKFIGVWIITSRFFFRHRLALLSTVLCASMLCESLGMLVFSSTPPLQVLCVGVSAALTSWLWPGFLTYIEGRQNTELLFAVLSASYVSAGNASRGTANWVLAWGVPPLWMPLVVGACALPVALVCLLLAHRCPTPSAEDVAVRTRRKGMSRRDKAAFVWEWLGGIVLLLVPYVTLSAVRNFRDFYSHQVFAAAMNVEQVCAVVGLLCCAACLWSVVDLPSRGWKQRARKNKRIAQFWNQGRGSSCYRNGTVQSQVPLSGTPLTRVKLQGTMDGDCTLCWTCRPSAPSGWGSYWGLLHMPSTRTNKRVPHLRAPLLLLLDDS